MPTGNRPPKGNGRGCGGGGGGGGWGQGGGGKRPKKANHGNKARESRS
jgi:hypothetical protein